MFFFTVKKCKSLFTKTILSLSSCLLYKKNKLGLGKQHFLNKNIKQRNKLLKKPGSAHSLPLCCLCLFCPLSCLSGSALHHYPLGEFTFNLINEMTKKDVSFRCSMFELDYKSYRRRASYQKKGRGVVPGVCKL